jgi:hypothetical protein
LIFVCLYRLFPSLLDASIIFKPETLLRWHRTGFRLFWRWKSRRMAGRPALSADIRSLVRRISRENALWGAPRIHGELLKLGIEIAGIGLDHARGASEAAGLAFRSRKRLVANAVAGEPLVQYRELSFILQHPAAALEARLVRLMKDDGVWIL